MQHLDEGTIHAWLDGALPVDEAARVERHASECRPCGAVVAEARGLVAASSRILSALDNVPAVVPGTGSGMGEAGVGKWEPGSGKPGFGRPVARPVSRRFWSRPPVLAAAAGIVVMLGTALVVRESGSDFTASADRVVRDSAISLRSEVRGTAAPDTAAAASGAALPVTPGSEGSARALRGGGAAAAVRREGARDVAAAEPPRRFPPAPPSEVRVLTPEPAQVQSAVVTSQPVADAAVAQRRSATSESQKAAQAAERAAPSMAPPSAAPAHAPSAAVAEGVDQRTASRRAAGQALAMRVDTVVGRVDTITVPGRVDTIVVDRPRTSAEYRGGGNRVVRVQRAFPVTACYRVVEGRGLPKEITLTDDAIWSGAAEQSRVATGTNARGYWSQPGTGDVHIVISGTTVKASIDPAGHLRGKVYRGTRSEPFLARRGCS